MDLDLTDKLQREDSESHHEHKQRQSRFSRLKEYIKKHKVGVSIGTVLFVGLIAFGIGFYFLRYGSGKKTEGSTTTQKTADGAPVTEKTYNVLDGLAVDPSVADRHPLAIIVENHVDARPQSGLDKASIVYEALAEGGITRFMALYSSSDAVKVGPVRSIRTYFVDWADGYKAYMAHVGGNIDALDQLISEKDYNLDQFAYSTPFWREYSAGLATEHTMYASTEKLWQQAAKNGYPSTNDFTVYKFKDDPTGDAASTLPPSQTITVSYGSNSQYNDYYQYNKSTNSYDRFMAGKPHTDNVSKKQLSPKNLIVMTVAEKSIKTRINEDGLSMTVLGSGKAQIFIDGKVISGTWKKATNASREIFSDENGNEITFNRGQFWISVVPPTATVKVQ